MAEEPPIYFHIPDDPEFLQAVAKVTITHAHLDYALRMCIKSLANLAIEEALDATNYEGSRALRDRIRRLARARLGEGQPLLKLQALMKRCEEFSEQRNGLTHHIIGITEEWKWLEHPMRRLPDHSWETLPSPKDLDKLADSITALVSDLNHARLSGWLAAALDQRPLP